MYIKILLNIQQSRSKNLDTILGCLLKPCLLIPRPALAQPPPLPTPSPTHPPTHPPTSSVGRLTGHNSQGIARSSQLIVLLIGFNYMLNRHPLLPLQVIDHWSVRSIIDLISVRRRSERAVHDRRFKVQL